VIGLRPATRADFPMIAGWLGQPHVARWWVHPPSVEFVEEYYGPAIDGTDPTELFIVEVDGRAAGLIQRYRHDDNPEWDAAVGVPSAAGIDYLIGEPDLVGRGIGTAAIAAFVPMVFARYPDLDRVVAVPQQANVGSWRILEKAGFRRVWAGTLDSDDPSDSGPSYVYAIDRPALSGP
jgi:aminoglycoside 6'-N-acetyltransferase